MTSKKIKFYAGSPLSSDLNGILRKKFFEEVNSSNLKDDHNFHTLEGMYSFVIAINIWEAILNELFQNDFMMNSDTIFNDAKEALEKWDIKTKTITYPKLLLGKTFSKKDSLWQEFQIVLGIRNEIIHFKSSLFEGPVKQVSYLRDKNLTFPIGESNMPWQQEVATTECMRFCINTVSKLVYQLNDLVEESGMDIIGVPFKEMYSPISVRDVYTEMNKKGISINENNNPFKNDI